MTSAPSASAMAIERMRRRRLCSSLRTIVCRFSSISSPKSSRRPADEDAQSIFDQQDRKEDEQIDDGEREQTARRALAALALALAAHPPGERDHSRAGHDCRHPVEHMRVAEKPRRGADRYEHRGIEQNLPSRLLHSRNNRQHRDAGSGIVVGANERQRPEMRRRPEEDDEKEETRLD